MENTLRESSIVMNKKNRVLSLLKTSGIPAEKGTRTLDPFITSEVLYQLSYFGTGN